MPENPENGKDTTLSALEAKLGYSFAQPTLLEQALTHGSLRYEQQMAEKAAPRGGGGNGTAARSRPGELGDNERMEFLGDAIVGLLVAESLFRRYPALSEGDLTRLRAALVSRKHLGEVGMQLKLGPWLRMGRSEEKSGGRTKALLLANCVEALAAAVYLDSGDLQAVKLFVEGAIVEPQAAQLYAELQANHAIGDYKSALQEFLQANGGKEPEYVLKDATGPDHRKRFLVEVRSAATDTDPGRALARGSGGTKKKAEQEAAKRAFLRLGGEKNGEKNIDGEQIIDGEQTSAELEME